jgi:hypothetical protein
VAATPMITQHFQACFLMPQFPLLPAPFLPLSAPMAFSFSLDPPKRRAESAGS